jgi:ribonuclease HI
MKKIIIYTDGSCIGNPGKGGWGAVLIYGEHEKEISGAEENTTNNRMEIMAVIQALAILKNKCRVDIYTDSKYVKNGITSWVYNWQKNNWKTANKKPVKNQDLWQQLIENTTKHEVEWHWVKGHDGDKYNEMADKLAHLAARA